VINPRICEGCGDCGRISNCLSVQPIETPFGRKTVIDQTTCNLDFSCLEGDCPAFMTISKPSRSWLRMAGWFRKRAPAARVEADRPVVVPEPPGPLPEPVLVVDPEEFSVRIAGIGGTGVVTVSQVLGTAAAFDGYEVRGLDQIGLSQKAGPVVSDLRLARRRPARTNRLGAGQADLLLAFDALVAASPAGLEVTHPDRTAVVGSTTRTPTGAMITRDGIELPASDELSDRIALATRRERRHWADASAITSAIFGDALAANIFVVGMAVQSGCLPIRPDAIERAIELNGVAAETNRSAFRWGRLQIARPEAVRAAVEAGAAQTPSEASLPGELAEQITSIAGQDADLDEMLRLFTSELIAYQDRRYARGFLETLQEVVLAESSVAPESRRLTRAVARGLHKLLAYKDEYEVARLMLDEQGLAEARKVAEGEGRISWRLHPPLLRALGMKRKIAVGAWAAPAFRLLAASRFLRGTRLDPFGHTRIRRIERELPEQYRGALRTVLADLKIERLDEAVAIASLPGDVRGYEDIKLARVNEFRERLAQQLERFGR
jgi:indolepyruvate ferredoxin oxidoreductase